MARAEWEAMSQAGRLQIDRSIGLIYVVNTADPHDYRGSASGTVFATFDVDPDLLVPGSMPQWSRIIGPHVPLAVSHLRCFPIKRMVYPDAPDSPEETIALQDARWVATQRFALDSFEAWARQLLHRCERAGLAIVWRERTENREKNSLGFEIIGESMMASIRVWASGEWETDVADELAPHSMISRYDPAHSAEEMIARVAAKLHASGLPI